MAINPHDDYEALAKLLYPSIEASGNVYYGQTRKLTMDEVLGKNDLGFESYIDSVRVEDETADYGYTYETFWKWKLGPLSGSFEYATDKAAYVYYGKYLLNIEAVAVDNDINSGNYKTYERELSSTFVGIVTTEGYDPTFTENYDGRNFYIVKENASWYLYVAVPQSDSAGIDFDGLKLTAKGGTVTVRLDTIGWQFPAGYAVYNYLLGGNSYAMGYLPASAQESEAYKNNSTTNYDLFDNEYIGEGIQLNDGESVIFKSLRDFDFTGNTFVRFRFDSTDTGALIEASGNLKYMGKHLNGSDTYVSSDYAFTHLFRSCSLLSKAPHLPVFASLHSSRQCEYESTFQGCTSLKYPPRLPDDGIAPNRYAHMFDGCTSLKTAPELRWKNLSNRCYLSMFDGCSSLKFVKCYAVRTDAHALATSNWLRGVSPNGIFYKTESLEYSRNGSGIPTGWEVRILSEDSANTDDSYTTNKLITSGSNSSNNGRGDITKKSTLANMEKSFDERNEHQMNTYNADGSYNQEIWGYKSFNSPVQFRNGVYGEQYLVSECTSGADEIKAVVSDIQNYTSVPKVTVIEPDSVNSSCYKSNNTSVTLSSAEFSDISDTASKPDIFNIYGVTPTVPYDDLWVTGSTQDSSNTVHISAATHTNKISEISVNSKTFPIIYVHRDLDMEGEPEYESNGITLYHNTHSEIYLSSKSEYAASILVSSRTSDLAGDSVSSIIMQSKSNHIPHLYSDIILPNCYVIVYENTYRYDKRNFIVALSTVSNEPQEDVVAKVSSNNDIYLLPPGVSKQVVASSENKSVDELTFIECICSDEQITSVLHNHTVGYDIKSVNDSYIGTGVTPFKQIHTTELLADKVFGHMPKSSKLNPEMQYSTRLLYLDYTGVDQINFDEVNRVAPLTFEIIDKGYVSGNTPTITIKTVPHGNVVYIPTEIKYAKISKTSVNIYNLQMSNYSSYAMGEITNLNTGDIIRVWVNEDITNTTFHFNISFSYGMKVSVSGNPARLYKKYTDNWYGSIERDYCFKELFKRYTQTSIGGIIDASNLYLNNISGVECCKSMFENNVNLEYPPVTLGCDGTGCCQYMFRNSDILFSPVNYYGNGGSNAYNEMFSNCNNIEVGYIIYQDTTNSDVFLNAFKDCRNITDIMILGTHYSNFSTLTSTQINTLKLNSLSNKNCNIFGYTTNPYISNMQDKDIDSIINRPLNSGDIVSTLFGEEFALVVYTAKIKITNSAGNVSVQPGKLMAKKWILLSDSSSYTNENDSVSYIDSSIVLATAL